MIRRLLDKLLYVEDDPSDRCFRNRRWRWTPSIELDSKERSLHIGIWLNLVQMDGQPIAPRVVQYADIQLQPFEWAFDQDHIYYDGPNCFYQFGPLCFAKSWNWCEKCYPSNNERRT